MYPRQEAAKIKQEFWTIFGQYMLPVLNAEGRKTNWINYKTGEPQVFFKMDADAEKASVSIRILHKDPDIRGLYLEQFAQLKNMLLQYTGESWEWRENIPDEHGKLFSQISKTLEDVSIFNRQDWPAIIQFLKPRIIALDAFWSEAKYAFEMLR